MHLGGIVKSKRKLLKMMTSGNSPCLDEVLKGKTIKGPSRTSRTFCSLVYVFSPRIGPPRIVMSGMGVLVVIQHLELLKPLCLGVVNVLGEGDEWRSRRGSVGSRNFEWRTGRWFKRQQLTLLLAAHARHADRKSTRLNSSHESTSRMPSSA